MAYASDDEEYDDVDDDFNYDEVEEEALEDENREIKPELKQLYEQHPECNIDYKEDVYKKLLSASAGEARRTYPFLTNYEKTKIIGLRANQLSKGSFPYIKVPEHIIDVKDIARLELEQKRLPFIIKRPLPNGTFEYWKLADLIIL
jgi:DNA-directed RNA polymerase subunit K/omega